MPDKPEVVTIQGANLLLHNSGIKRGQTEALTGAATALHAAVQHYRTHYPDLLPVLQPILENLAKQFATQAKETALQQNALLGEYVAQDRLAQVLDSQTKEQEAMAERMEKRKRKLQRS